MKKKLLSVMCAAVFSVFMLTACGNDEPQDYPEDDIEDYDFEEDDDINTDAENDKESRWDAEWEEDEDGWMTSGTTEYDLNDNYGGDFTGIWQCVDNEDITLTIKNLEDWEKGFMMDSGIYKLVSDTKMELYDEFDRDEPLETLTMLPDGTIESDKDGIFKKIKDYDIMED